MENKCKECKKEHSHKHISYNDEVKQNVWCAGCCPVCKIARDYANKGES